eukprot:1418416-Alexandrium_andersonii.AAC.1
MPAPPPPRRIPPPPGWRWDPHPGRRPCQDHPPTPALGNGRGYDGPSAKASPTKQGDTLDRATAGPRSGELRARLTLPPERYKPH